MVSWGWGCRRESVPRIRRSCSLNEISKKWQVTGQREEGREVRAGWRPGGAKGPLFPTTWAHQARSVGIRGLPRQSEGPGASEKGVPLRPAPGAGWELREAAGNFPGAQQARRGGSHRRRHNERVAAGPDGLCSRPRGTRDRRPAFAQLFGVLLALCLSTLDLPFRDPQREGTSQQVPCKLEIC